MAEIGELWIKVGAKIDAFEKNMSAVDKAIVTIGNKCKDVGQKFQDMGKSMTIAGAAILAPIGGAVMAFSKFDAAMTESLAIMGDLSDKMRKDMVDATKKVATETTFSAKEAAKAFFYLASAGLSAEESLKALPVVAKFAQAGMFDMATATSLLADAQSALGMKVKNDAVKNMENMIRVSDVLSRANILANATIQQFSESLTNRAGAALKIVNKDIEEGAAVLSAFADQGVKGAEAGVRLDIVLRDLQTRAIKNADVFKKFGVTVYDSSGNMRNMADILADLERLFDGMTDAQKRTTLMQMEFQDRSVSSILMLIGMSEQIKNYETELRKAGGTTEEIAKKQLETFSSQMKLIKNNIENAAISIGSTLAPVLMALAEKIQAIVKRITDWIDKNQTLVKWIAILGGAFGSLLLAGGSIIFMFGSLLRSIGSIILILPMLKAGLGALAAPLGVAATGFGVLAAALALAYGAYKLLIEARKDLEKSKGKFVDEETKAWTKLTKEIGGYSSFVDQAARAEIASKEKLMAIWDKYGQNTTDTFKAIAEGAEGKKLQEFLEKLGGKHLETAQSAGGHTKAENELQKELKRIKEEIKGLLKPMDDFNLGMETLAEAIGLVLKTDLEKKLKQYKDALKKYRQEGQLTAEAEKELIDKIEETEVALGKKEKRLKTLVPLIEDAGEATGIWALALKMLKKPAEQADQAFQELVDKIHNFKIGTEEIIESTEDLGDAWKDVLDDMGKAFGEAFANIIKDAKNFGDYLEAIFQGCINAIATMIGRQLSKTFSDLFDKMAKEIGAMATTIVIAFAAYVIPNLIKHLLTVFGVIEEEIDAAGQAILDKLEKARRAGEKVLEVVRKTALKASGKKAVGGVPIGTTEAEKELRESLMRISLMLQIFAKTGKVNLYDLDEAWQSLISTVKKLGLEGSKAFVDLILKMREAGLESKALNEYIQDQLDRIPKALSSLIAAFDETGGSITDLGNIALHAFNAMLASGVSFTDAVFKMQDPLAALKAKYAELGITGDEALQRLFHIVDITVAHQELFTAIEANREILEALGNSGWLTSEAMEALTRNAVSYYNQLQAAGMTSDEALRAMAPTLQKIYDYAKAYGLAIDDATMSLIEDAKEAGYVKEIHDDMATVLDDIRSILKDIKDILSGGLKDSAKDVRDIFDDWGREIDDAERAMKGLGDSFKNIDGGFGKLEIPNYQHGGIAWRPQIAKIGEVPEAIIPLENLRAWGKGVPAAGMTNYINLTINAQRLDDMTIDKAAEKIFHAVERQAERRRG